METHPRSALARLRAVSAAALRRAALWGLGAFAASVALVALVVWLADGAGASLKAPAVFVALALGLATGWASGLIALTLETVRLTAASVEASMARRQR